MLFFVLVMF